MKYALIALFFSFNAMATVPSSPGDFAGLLFTGGSLYQPIQIQGGVLSDCTKPGGSTHEIYQCSVKGAQMIIKKEGHLDETYEFDKVGVNQGEKERNFYYKGVRSLTIQNQKIDQPVSVTLNVKDEEEGRAWGFVKLSQFSIQSAFEVYLNR